METVPSVLLLEALDQPALVVRDGRIVAANELARRLLGAAIEGQDVRLAIRNPGALEPILAGEPGDYNVTGIAEIGRSWNVSVRALDPNSVLVSLVDRTASVAADKMRVDFVANASHELRTPLTTVIGYAETLADDANLEPGLVTKFGATIGQEGRRMMHIIEDLMSLSRIEADRFDLPAGTVAVGVLIALAVANAREMAARHKCKIEVKLARNLPRLRGDDAQLVQLLDNLLANSLRYRSPARQCQIQVSAVLEGAMLRLEVRDNGRGIPAEHLRRVTERFYRVDAARGVDSGGTGLGLAIVKHIVERHRGTLEIQSGAGEGTTAVVCLPADVA